MSQAAGEPEGPSLGRRVLLPAGALALLAGVALGAFYLMHTFATGPDAAVASVTPTKAETTVAAVAQIPAVPAEAPKASVTAAQNTAERVAAPATSMKTAAIAPKGIAVAAKVPAPDNARWGEAADANPKPAPQPQVAEEADTGPKVNDPQSAPVPTEAPKMAAPKTEAPKAEPVKKLAYAAPSEASHPVDKAATAALPPAAPSKDAALPGVNSSPLSVPAEASAGEAGGGAGGYMSTVSSDVRLHASASGSSRSIGVVPRKATVHVLNCKGWCRISYKGQEGYIYKSFLGRASAPAPAPAAPEKAAAASATQTQQNTAKPAAAANAEALKAAAERTLMQRD